MRNLAKQIGLCAALLLFSHAAYGCINITGTKYNGQSVSTGGSMAGHLRNALNKDTHPDGIQMEAELSGATNYNERSDYSVALMYLSRNREAVELLNKLEQEQPGHYFIAANLGTAYELSGNNEEALRWINEGIHRNPDSHEGTEWLHAKILAAKIAQQTDPDYFRKHSVLELHPETIGKVITVDGETMHPADLAHAIEHQLSERLQFVKPPDAPVASLLFDYAAIEAATRTLESAQGILQLAAEYGYPDEKIKPLLTLYDHRIAWRKAKGYGFYAMLAALFILLLYRLYQRGIFVISSRDLKRT